MLFLSSLSDIESPEVSGIFLRILPDINYAVVWMFSTSLNNKSSSPLTNLLGIVSSKISIASI